MLKYSCENKIVADLFFAQLGEEKKLKITKFNKHWNVEKST